ncbi:MAG: hypothetical protein H8D23_15965, partial [Candidatus Brocadiales bacterium]|nr:hypothetical protein [Candidatus Brocadiales bacterium]
MKRDHDILHMFLDNPAMASTRHALVTNDMYGIKHEVAYNQDTLTKEQIADMHAELVKLYDPVDHDTPMANPTTKEKQHI